MWTNTDYIYSVFGIICKNIKGELLLKMWGIDMPGGGMLLLLRLQVTSQLRGINDLIYMQSGNSIPFLSPSVTYIPEPLSLLKSSPLLHILSSEHRWLLPLSWLHVILSSISSRRFSVLRIEEGIYTWQALQACAAEWQKIGEKSGLVRSRIWRIEQGKS